MALSNDISLTFDIYYITSTQDVSGGHEAVLRSYLIQANQKKFKSGEVFHRNERLFE